MLSTTTYWQVFFNQCLCQLIIVILLPTITALVYNIWSKTVAAPNLVNLSLVLFESSPPSVLTPLQVKSHSNGSMADSNIFFMYYIYHYSSFYFNLYNTPYYFTNPTEYCYHFCYRQKIDENYPNYLPYSFILTDC